MDRLHNTGFYDSLTAGLEVELLCAWLSQNALLRLKAEIAPLLPGSVTLEIKNLGTLRLCVGADNAHCERTDTSADFSFTHAQATRLFFEPLPAVSACDLGASHAAALLQAWLPCR